MKRNNRNRFISEAKQFMITSHQNFRQNTRMDARQFISITSRDTVRGPSSGDREKIKKLLKKLDKVYKTSSPFRYKNLTLPWKKWLAGNDAKSSELSPRGELEQYEIAKRWRLHFPEVFDKQYWNKYYKFIARDKRRTSQSAMAFALGLFENETGSLGKYLLDSDELICI